LPSRAQVRQVSKEGIRVTAWLPAWTPLQPSLDKWKRKSEKKILDFGSQTPMERPGQPVEMARLYLLLASQESSYVTGEI
jgi:NAD(P)-dependent dehydrogenase (short-subunit alcohol dehydrogenase family)